VAAKEAAIATRGPSRFETDFSVGRQLTREAAIALALGEPARPAATPPVGRNAELLGKREADVAKLVAEGVGNKQIGARLFISERTVDGHVRSILNKLGCTSRAQIAAWRASSDD
jgi:DNA-binding NarL/FixJ family response regulator